MKNWQTSLYGQIAYMFPMGLGFLFQPNMVLSLLGLPGTEEPWLRLVGLLALVLTVYYYSAVRSNSIDFARASVWGRLGFCLGLACISYAFGLHIMYLFVAIEAALALWTKMVLPGAGA